jgi:hypothetical protein
VVKTCFKCKQEKPLGAFYRRVDSPDGFRNDCKDCHHERTALYRKERPIPKRAEYQREWKAKNPDKLAVYAERYAENNARNTREWRAADKRRAFAHGRVSYAMTTGILEKLPCFICGGEKSEAHHPSYDLPLDVVWLCSIHHNQLHREHRNDNL